MIYECLECGTVFESDARHPECPNEETGLETHAVRPLRTADSRQPRRRRGWFRRR